MEQWSPSPSIVAFVPVSAQSTPSSVPNESGHVMEELPCSSPKAPAFSTPVSVPAQSVTVSAAPATVTVSASPVTFPVSAIVSVAPVTGSVSPAIVTAPAPATVTASSAMVTASVPTTVTAPVSTSSSGIVRASQVSVTPPTASNDDFPKFSGDQDTAETKSRAYIRKCMTN
ncbi:LOW QUALITY PROTEIN: calphotin-like [Acropora millepora]|uniref:LOW QUALITY PROTEIN: calphotin-like n=1 Tax=Acropora millepora TaxID=45264 RepID=UPI001CF42482|nr:LOW QUALITY PROTEIN: calphotin-like [Acropora millepora]